MDFFQVKQKQIKTFSIYVDHICNWFWNRMFVLLTFTFKRSFVFRKAYQVVSDKSIQHFLNTAKRFQKLIKSNSLELINHKCKVKVAQIAVI